MACRFEIFALSATLLSSACFVDPPSTASDDDDGGGTTSTTDSVTSGISITTGVSISTTADPTSATSDDDSTGILTVGDSTSGSDTTAVDSESSDSTEGDVDGSSSSSSSSSSGPAVLGVEDLGEGDLLITEIMGNPNCLGDNCEWFEILNTTPLPIDLQGLGVGNHDTIQGTSPATFVTESAILEPGALGVLSLNQSWPYADEPLASYGNDGRLPNDEINQIAVFGPDRFIIDESATFLPFDAPSSGRSFSLMPDFWGSQANNVGANWCWSDVVLPVDTGNSDWGTPGSDEVGCVAISNP